MSALEDARNHLQLVREHVMAAAMAMQLAQKTSAEAELLGALLSLQLAEDELVLLEHSKPTECPCGEGKNPLHALITHEPNGGERG